MPKHDDKVSRREFLEKTAIADCETSMMRRRSKRSATMPPQREKMMMGSTRVRPTRPSARGEPVST